MWIRDQHEGLSKALSEDYAGQLQQRCIVHWRKIKNTNPIEQLNEEIRRRERSIRIFPIENSCEI